MYGSTRGRRRLVLAGCGIATLAMLASATIVSFRAGASWSAMEEQKEQLRRKFHARPQKREPLWGEVIKGAAFSHYGHALAAARPLSKQLPPPARLFAIDDEQLAAEVEPFRARWAPMLASLRAGAHSANASPPPLGDEPETSTENLLDCRWVVNIAILEARVLRCEGRSVEAVQHTLDAAQFGADLLRRGSLINQMIAVAILTIATDCWPEEKLRRLDRSALDLLASGLERLDRALPETLDLTGELLFLSHSLRWATTDDSWVPSFEWRYGFSSRWMIADAFLQVAGAAAQLEADPSVPWSKRQAQIDEWFRRLSEGANPVVSIMIPNFTSAERNLRQALTILRLLRASLELHRGNEAPPLRDPLGDGPLLVSADAAGVKLRSAGTLRDQPLERTFVH
ncbi:MAG TPA: hypothetical protein VFT55_06240 [Planctomycetota bacterium]|nr:hypothetical protein [Planctomycetota bacterium]